MVLRLGATLLGLIWCIHPPVWATTVIEKDFAALVQEADTIIFGTVVTLEVTVEQEMPFTLATFSDLRVLKGTVADADYTVRLLGGPTPDGARLTIAGTPTFSLGNRYIVFIVGNETHAIPFVGLWQGVYQVMRDPDYGDTMATHAGQPLTALPQRQTPDGLVYDDAPPAVQPQRAPALPLDYFLNAIAEEVQHGG